MQASSATLAVNVIPCCHLSVSRSAKLRCSSRLQARGSRQSPCPHCLLSHGVREFPHDLVFVVFQISFPTSLSIQLGIEGLATEISSSHHPSGESPATRTSGRGQPLACQGRSQHTVCRLNLSTEHGSRPLEIIGSCGQSPTSQELIAS